jgi:hypothetical protein
VAALEAGERVEPLRLVCLLRRSECPRRLVEAVCASGQPLRDRRVLALIVRHPACPQRVAWDGLPSLMWRELHEVCRDPRTPPAVRAQAERKLADRLANLTLGERIALARVATHGVIPALLTEEDPHCVEALLDNPQLTEIHVLRLLNSNRVMGCLQAVLRHARWGQRPSLVAAAVRLRHLPLVLALGLAVSLSDRELADLGASIEIREPLRAAIAELLAHREASRRHSGATPP